MLVRLRNGVADGRVGKRRHTNDRGDDDRSNDRNDAANDGKIALTPTSWG